ncbi:hypothetical protein bthur0010_56410 [Bacillus thuringiensis serovar pondicheriensis BGSC 4BA1]|nr:hypothetical protein RBTH_07350 [Bacillus thuringiensis serovar israelensis ATCC 35646]EEM74340.1 hypothetical protein bthur0010_56410 [Bacillus thuringiensis serovar pondicheriensis BGSC 4BA1]MED3015116.1 hypothetical protein [Bacillus thuringiensis]
MEFEKEPVGSPIVDVEKVAKGKAKELKKVEELLNKKHGQVLFAYETKSETFWMTEQENEIVVLGVDGEGKVIEMAKDYADYFNHLYTYPVNAATREALRNGKLNELESKAKNYVMDSMYRIALTYWFSEDDVRLDTICDMVGEDRLVVIRDSIVQRQNGIGAELLDKETLELSLSLENMRVKREMQRLLDEEKYELLSLEADRMNELKKAVRKYLNKKYSFMRNTGK